MPKLNIARQCPQNLEAFNGHSKAELQAMDLAAELNEFNLFSYLTSSRTNGVLGILKRIKS